MRSIIALCVLFCILGSGCGDKSTTSPQTRPPEYRLFPENAGANGWTVQLDAQRIRIGEEPATGQVTFSCNFQRTTGFGDIIIDHYTAGLNGLGYEVTTHFDALTFFPEHVMNYSTRTFNVVEHHSVPQTAVVGESGPLTSWLEHLGTARMTGKWYLEDSGDGFGNLRFEYIVTTSKDNTDFTAHNCVFTINTDGELQRISSDLRDTFIAGSVTSTTPSADPIRFVSSWEHFALF